MSAAPAIGAEYDAALVSSRYRCLVEQLGEAVDHRRGWKARAAEVLGVTPGYVSKVLGGVATAVTEPTMRKACDALDIGPEFFLAAEPERVPRDVAERALAAVEPEPTVTIPAARYAEMLRDRDALHESRDHALDRVRELEELLRAGTPKARAIAVLRAEGIEPVPADEVRAMRAASDEARAALAAETDRANEERHEVHRICVALGLDEEESNADFAIDEIECRADFLADETKRLRDGLDALEALVRRVVREVRDPKTSAAIVEDLDATMREVRGG